MKCPEPLFRILIISENHLTDAHGQLYVSSKTKKLYRSKVDVRKFHQYW